MALRATLLVALFVSFAAVAEEAVDFLDRGNQAIQRLNEIGTKELSAAGVYISFPRASKELISNLSKEQLAEAKRLLEEYVVNADVILDVASRKGVAPYHDSRKVQHLKANAQELLASINMKLASN